MNRILATTMLSATTVGTLLFLPAGPAQAQSTACSTAIDLINAAITESGGNLDPETANSLSTKLLAVNASGTDKDAIAAYARALVDDKVPDMAAATVDFNRSCAG
ncbi:hypothetical protein [Nocardia sp. NPDC057440]|uniref:hypothetical protein n=1 Tax=Nocardia sp. NPDC057440 TaxID=3346134 RepID=UPI00366AC461